MFTLHETNSKKPMKIGGNHPKRVHNRVPTDAVGPNRGRWNLWRCFGPKVDWPRTYQDKTSILIYKYIDIIYIYILKYMYTYKSYMYIWLCSKIPLSAKRVAWEVWFGGMIRSMFRRYDSPHLLSCLHKDYILYQRALSYTKLATGVVFWRGRLGHGTAKQVWVWFGVCIGYDSRYDSGRRLFLQKYSRRTELCQIQNTKDAHLVH